MMTNLTLIEGAYLRDVLDQPRTIRDTASALETSHELNQFAQSLSPESYQRIVLTGMGGSFHILNPLYLRLVELGFSVVMAETSELIYFTPKLLNDRCGAQKLIGHPQDSEIARFFVVLPDPAQRPLAFAN